MDRELYIKIRNRLDDVSKILSGCEIRKERMYPDQYKPLKDKVRQIESEINSISEF